jgi:hypothetical protein
MVGSGVARRAGSAAGYEFSTRPPVQSRTAVVAKAGAATEFYGRVLGGFDSGSPILLRPAAPRPPPDIVAEDVDTMTATEAMLWSAHQAAGFAPVPLAELPLEDLPGR